MIFLIILILVVYRLHRVLIYFLKVNHIHHFRSILQI
nr:MAG TPA: hypothetical protein [Caudoviricetes sp.]